MEFLGRLVRCVIELAAFGRMLSISGVAKEWATYYNTARPHMSLGPGIPIPPETLPAPVRLLRHQLADKLVGSARSVLGGLHHDYRLAAVPI